MEISNISPAAVIAGILGAVIGFIILKGLGGMNITGEEVQLGLIWRILIPIGCGVGGFFVVQKMAE